MHGVAHMKLPIITSRVSDWPITDHRVACSERKLLISSYD